MEKLIIQSGGDGHNTFAIKGSDTIYHYNDSTTATTVTVPTGAKFALFSSTGDFFARWSGTAAVPAGDVSDGTGSECNPIVRSVEAGDTFSIVAASADTLISIAFYS